MKKIIKVYYGDGLVRTFKNAKDIKIGRETIIVTYYGKNFTEWHTTFFYDDVRHYKIDTWLRS